VEASFPAFAAPGIIGRRRGNNGRAVVPSRGALASATIASQAGPTRWVVPVLPRMETESMQPQQQRAFVAARRRLVTTGGARRLGSWLVAFSLRLGWWFVCRRPGFVFTARRRLFPTRGGCCLIR